MITVLVFASFQIQNSFGHSPEVDPTTSKEILEFCEFFYDEYELLGVDSLIDHHPQYPNLRGCVILYNHIAWNSTHEARDIVLIAEIDNYMGNSDYMRDRHVEYSDIMPEWIKREAQLWVNNENQDKGFAYGIRTLLEAQVITLDHNEKQCIENKICFKENDFIKYSHFDKYGNNISIEHTVKSIENNQIIIETKEVSQQGIIKDEITINDEGVIENKACCEYYEFVLPTQLKSGDIISENLKIVAETTYVVDNQVREAWLANDETKQNVKIIDKKTGLLFVYEHHETEVLTVGDETKITDTNFFNTKYDMELHQIEIPEWWKKATSWLLDERISESEYLRAIENLISRNIIKV